jgi:hypothetical protein
MVNLDYKYEELKKSHQRLAYLIKNQFEKKVPQILYRFIDEALTNQKTEDL